MPVKVFTLEEANRLLPEIRRCVRAAQATVRRIMPLQDQLAVLEVLGGGQPKSPEHGSFRRKQDELEEAASAFNERLEELQRLGCVLKDLNHGLVDFYAQKEGRLIFLCWRLEEPSIGYWHELDGGMAGRRPVVEL